MSAVGHNQPIIDSTQRSLERLLLSETCRIVSFRTSSLCEASHNAEEGTVVAAGLKVDSD
jgi:hypothetical protein